MNTDRNLLFGLLAVQLDFTRRDQFLAGINVWRIAKHRPLGDVLVQQGALSSARRALLDALVAEYLAQHDGDTNKCLSALSSIGDLRRELDQLADTEVTLSLAAVAVTRGAEDAAQFNRSAGVDPLGGPRFRILRAHAKGGIGQVYVAEDTELHREVALKEILGGHADQPESRARFLLEAEVTGGLEHPGIVPVYGLGTYADGRPYYAMRFIRGDSLKDAIDRFHDSSSSSGANFDGVEFRNLLGRFIDVCQAIAYAHSRRILHRDLKPGNIMLGKYGETLVVDWGLAKPLGAKEPAAAPAHESALLPASSESASETIFGTAAGTPQYMSPEQAAGRWDIVGTPSDIYGLGATLYAVLTGRAPIRGADQAEVLRHVTAGEFSRPRAVQPAVPPALEAACLKAMALRPEDRYATAQDVAVDLEHWLADEPVSAWREPWTVRSRRWARRHRTFVTAAMGLLITSLVALGIGLWAVNRERQQTLLALDAEAKARARTRQSLDAMSSDVIENLLVRQPGGKLEPAQAKFLDQALASYQEFAAETGASADVRAGVAGAHMRIGYIHQKFGRADDAVAEFRRAADMFQSVADADRGNPKHRQFRKQCLHNIGVVFLETNRLAEAEPALIAAEEQARQLTADFPDVPDYRRDLGITLIVRANSLNSQDKEDKSIDVYRQAIDVLKPLAEEFPKEAANQRELATCYSNQGGSLETLGRRPEADISFSNAIAILRLLAADPAADATTRSRLGHALNGRGSCRSKSNQVALAEADVRECITQFAALVSEYPAVADYRSRLGRGYQQLAILFATSGRMIESEAAFRDNVATRKRLAEDFPKSPRYQADLASAYTNLGVTLFRIDRLADAEKAYRDALAINRKLVADYPDMPGYRYDTALKLFNLALLYTKLQNHPAAEAAYRESLTLANKLATENPALPDNAMLAAKAQTALADVLNATGRPAEAETATREAMATLSRLSVQSPGVPLFRQEHSLSLQRLGQLLTTANRHDEAAAAFSESATLHRKLVAEAPNQSHYKFELAISLDGLAERTNVLGDAAKARQLFDEAKPLYEAAIQGNPRGGTYRSRQRENRMAVAAISIRDGDHAAAADIADWVSKSNAKPADDWAKAASISSRCSAVATKDEKLSADQRATTANQYADRAMAALREAVKAGYNDVVQLKNDTDLDPLRDREDFKKLLTEVEKTSVEDKKRAEQKKP